MHCVIVESSTLPYDSCIHHRNKEREVKMTDNEVNEVQDLGDKYIVLRNDRFAIIAPTIEFPSDDVKQMFLDAIVDDAVVIRLQDSFAADALFGYANSIQMAIKILDKAGLNEVTEGLKRTADYFAAKAEEALSVTTKLPD